MRRKTIITVGGGDAEIKIYTLKRKDGYPSFQCVWYELGRRKTKTFASVDAAKLFAQQTLSSCRHELPAADPVTQWGGVKQGALGRLLTGGRRWSCKLLLPVFSR